MAKGIVMLHGANAGGWCFERFRTVFESLGWTCHTPDLIGHGNAATCKNRRRWYGGLLRSATVISDVVRCAARHPRALYGSAARTTLGPLAQALILVSPAPRAGVLPATDGEKQLARDLTIHDTAELRARRRLLAQSCAARGASRRFR